VGGIIGINRRIDADGLRSAVRTGSLEHLLFPHDVIHDAPQIIHDLEAVLPAADGHYVFGPMAKIGWGTPTIIEAELGIILELPVGGFNPGFQPPPAFPALRRVTVDLGVSGNPSLTMQSYFAITSNSAQVGALAELRAHGGGIDLYGRVQFDAIVIFSPFSFE